MTSQGNEKSPPDPKASCEPIMDLYIENGAPIFVKRNPKANKQKSTSSNNDTKIRVFHDLNPGRPLVFCKADGDINVTSTRAVRCNRRETLMNTAKMTGDLTTPRLTLHIINLVLHISNLGQLHRIAESITEPDPQVAKFMAMRFRYFTTWVVLLHIFYSVYALGLDTHRKFVTIEMIKYPNPDFSVRFIARLMNSMEIFYRSILWPSTLVVVIFFWSLYNYERELIFPVFVDEIIDGISNQILHTWIGIFIFLEVLVRPRLRFAVHGPTLPAMFIFLIVYLISFYYTVYSEGFWLYPIFSVAYNNGIISFLFLHLVLLGLFLFSYGLLWVVNDHFHKHRQTINKQIRSFRIHWK